jgi:hypothetical protein
MMMRKSDSKAAAPAASLNHSGIAVEFFGEIEASPKLPMASVRFR